MLKRVGKKGHEWATVLAELKSKFIAAGINECELRLPGCWRRNGWTFAHAVKRRHCKPDAKPGSPYNLRTVCRACVACHEQIERMPPALMEKYVMAAIAKRGKS